MQELANAAIEALNKLFDPSDSARFRAARDAGAAPAVGSRIHEVHKYIIACVIPFVDSPVSGVGCIHSTENEVYDSVGDGVAVSSEASLLS